MSSCGKTSIASEEGVMIKDITLGQYFPGDSIVHRLDPRTKLILTLVYIVALFTSGGYLSYAFMFAVLLTCILLSKINLKTILRSIKPLLFIIVFTFILNLLFTKGTAIFSFWFITVTYEGVELAVRMIIRLIMLIVGTFLLTYTTSPISLTDGIEKSSESAEKDPGARTRAGDDDEYCAAVYPDAH